MSLVDVPEPAADPVRSDSVTTASRAPGARKPGPTRAGGDRDDARRGVGAVGDEPARDVVLGEHLGDALGQARTLGGDEHRPVVGDEAAQLGDGLLGVAAEGR